LKNVRERVLIQANLLDDRPRNYRSGPYDRPRQNFRPVDEPEDIEMRLKGLIIKIGDKVGAYNSQQRGVNI
jgi:hypothetical protein